jgi:hypothetical protein
MSLRDAIYRMCLKVYSSHGGRKAEDAMDIAKDRGHLSEHRHFNSTANYLRDPKLTPILKDLVTQSSLPFTELERVFACDSSGFGTSQFMRWSRDKPNSQSDSEPASELTPESEVEQEGKKKRKHGWIKAHIMIGVKTNVVTAIEVTRHMGKGTNDTNFLRPLLKQTTRYFEVEEVLADKAYISKENLKAVYGIGAEPFIPFRSNHTGKAGGLWARAHHEFSLHPERFNDHYHQRSNVESTFRMVKSQFLDYVRSKHESGMFNEVLIKFLCHNICCVNQEMHEMEIDPKFEVKNVAEVETISA